MNQKYGFIITRHVNSEKTNKYWNHSVRCIRRFYPFRRIIIIDDNSDYSFVKSDFEYKNTLFIQSEFKGRGELLPYYYLYKYKFFENAVILHDSVFFHKRIHFEQFNVPVMPLWHFHFTEDSSNCIRLASALKDSNIIIEKVSENTVQTMGFRNNNIWHGCFGVQSYINLKFLSLIQEKYSLFNLLNLVISRNDRCSLERVMGAIFYTECPSLYKSPSLFGDILASGTWGYSFAQYSKEYKYIKKPLVKVWTGR